MPTGFDKFKSKALAEEGIRIEQAPASRPEKEAPKAPARKTPEKKEVEKLSAVTGVAKPRAKKAEEPGEGTFQMTIVIKMDTKRRLDELKYLHRKSYKELAEEAFDDLYKKYGK